MSATADPAALATALADAATPDDVIARLAGETDAAGAALIVAAEERWRRHPAILERLFANARVPMAVANDAVARAARAGVTVDGIPAFTEVAAAIAADPEATDPTRVDGPFQAALERTSGADADADEDDDDENEPASPVPAPSPAAAKKPPAEKKRKSPIIDFTKLKLYEKVRLATLGNAYCRQNLLRDSNRLVALAAIRSPGITDSEVVRAAGNRALSEDVIRYIANRKEYVKLYSVKLSLIQNPKCPLATSMRLIAFLHAEDLKGIARSKNVPGALSTAAKKLILARESK